MRYADCHPDKKHKGRGLCNTCWSREWRRANPGRQWQDRNPEEATEYQRAWYAANRDRIAEQRRTNRADGRFKSRDRRLWLRYRYGLTPEQYRDQLIGQAGRCAICGLVPTKDLVVDHVHESGRFRGLLCGTCNTGIGSLRDDPKRMLAAARYVEVAL